MKETARNLMLGALVSEWLELLSSGTGTIKILVTLQEGAPKGFLINNNPIVTPTARDAAGRQFRVLTRDSGYVSFAPQLKLSG